MTGERVSRVPSDAVPVRQRRLPWSVAVLGSFSRGRPLMVLVSVVAVGVGVGSQSTAIGVLAGLAAGVGAWKGFPKLAQHFYTRERNRTRPRGS